jgi:subtilase family serine protease
VFLDATDIALPETRTVGPLAAGAASPGMTTVTIPADTASGFYYLFAQADAGNAVVEAIETNNVRSTTIRIGGDLTVSSLAAPTRAAVGASITITDTTRNVGGGAITVPTTTAFYLSTNISLDAADIRIQTARTVPPLGPNEWSTAPTTVTLPAVAPGTWYLIANADDGKAAGETTETNNTRFTTIAIGPDLTFVAVTAPGSAVSGTSITVNETVRNIGAGDAPATVVRFYLSNNSVFDAADVPLAASREVPALASNTQSGGATSVPLPSGTTGSFYLLVVADGTNAVAESSEGNNVTPRLIQITPGT